MFSNPIFMIIILQDAPAKNRSSILSIMETMHGFGLMVGPFIGGLLYEIGGFYFPFAICGGLLMLSALLSALFLSKGKENKVGQNSVLSNDVSDDESASVVVTTPTTYRKLIKI